MKTPKTSTLADRIAAMNHTGVVAAQTKYEGRVPATLRNWIAKHAADKVVEVSHGGGFSTESGNAYDVLLVAGWRLGREYDWMHTIIEPTVRDVIDRLRTIEPCDDDDECRAARAARNQPATTVEGGR